MAQSEPKVTNLFSYYAILLYFPLLEILLTIRNSDIILGLGHCNLQILYSIDTLLH
jgi:hypothetical protein